MALESKINVRIRALIQGIPELQSFVKSLKEVKGQSINTAFFGQFAGAAGQLAGVSQAFGAANTNANAFRRSITLTAKEINGQLVPVVKLGNEAKQVNTIFKGLGLTLTNSGFKGLTFDIQSILPLFGRVIGFVAEMAVKFALLATVVGGVAVSAFIALGVQYNAFISNARVALSAILNTAGSITEVGTKRVLTGIEGINVGLKFADDLIEKVRIQAGKLGVPFEGVLRALQDGIGPALANLGLTLTQISQVVPAIAAAATVAGLPIEQFAQEVRALFSGDIDRNARIAQILGITPKDVDRLKGKSKEYFDFIQDRLKSFVAAGPIIEQTLGGAFVLATDQFKRFAGAVTEGLSGEIVKALNFIRKSFTEDGDFTPPVKRFVEAFDKGLKTIGSLIGGIITTLVTGFQALIKEPERLNEFLVLTLGILAGIINATFEILKNFTKTNDKAGVLLSLISKIGTATSILVAVFGAVLDIVNLSIGQIKILATGFQPFVFILSKLGVITEEAFNTFSNFASLADGIKQVGEGLSFKNARVGFKAFQDGFKIIEEGLKGAKTEAFDLDAFLKNFNFDPRLKKPEVKKDTKGKRGKEEPNLQAETELRAAQLALEKATADAIADVLRNRINNETDVLESAYNSRLITIEDYYKNKLRLEKASSEITLKQLDAELKAVQTRITESKAQQEDQATQIFKKGRDDPKGVTALKVANAAVPFEAERTKAEAERVKILSQIKVIQDSTAAGAEKNTREQIAATDAFIKQFDSLKVQLLETKGLFEEAAGVGFDQQNQDVISLLEKMTLINPAMQSYIELLKQARAIAVQDAQERQFNVRFTTIRAQQELALQNIENSRRKGLISEREAHDAIVKLQKEQIAIQIKLLEGQLALADTESKRVDLELQIAKIKGETDDLKTSLEQDFEDIRDAITSALSDAFASIIDGSKSVKEAFADLGRSIIQIMAKVVANALAGLFIKLLIGSLGAGGGGGGGGGLLGGLFGGGGGGGGGGGFAGGGLVRGPGTSTSDSIPALLSDKEFVIRAASVRMFGADFFHSLNQGRIPRFSDGGQVNPDTQHQSIGDRVSFKNVNVLDPRMLTDAMMTTTGERVFLNLIGRNRSAVKRLLR